MKKKTFIDTIYSPYFQAFIVFLKYYPLTKGSHSYTQLQGTIFGKVSKISLSYFELSRGKLQEIVQTILVNSTSGKVVLFLKFTHGTYLVFTEELTPELLRTTGGTVRV